MSEERVLKVVILGDPAVGKTSFLIRFAEDRFPDKSEEIMGTIGQFARDMKIGKTTLNMWDTGGEEHFRKITNSSYRGAHAFMLMYDITSKSSFDNLDTWMSEILHHKSAQNCDGVPIIVVGNKTDRAVERQVTVDDLKAYGKQHRIAVVEGCASTGAGVSKAFEQLIKIVDEKAAWEGEQERNRQNDRDKMKAEVQATRKKKKTPFLTFIKRKLSTES